MSDKQTSSAILQTPALLAILDGVGLREATPDNAVATANAPFLKSLLSNTDYPCIAISASGRDVGLPPGQMGNSEVGHLNIGAGRIIQQELTRIDSAIEDATFYTNDVLVNACEAARDNANTIHLMGLVSDGGVHSSYSHLLALLKLAAQSGCKRVRVHAFLDGRDVSPTSGVTYIKQLESDCTTIVSKHMGLDLRIASICGRYFAMDRDNRWERVKEAWRCLTLPYEPDVQKFSAQSSLTDLLEDSYEQGINDEFVIPMAAGDRGIRDGDTVIFFNFRPDRARELTRAFTDSNFEQYGFVRPIFPQLNFVTMTEYDPKFEAFGVKVAFPKSFPEDTLADLLAQAHLRQYHIAETEKYAHVTFFLNGGIEKPKDGEQRVLIPSPKVATYDLMPQMSALEVSATLCKDIRNDVADVYIVNFANGDMVGHTGIFDAAVLAIEAVDIALAAVVKEIVEKNGLALITADHGNSEQMLDESGSPWTAHTSSPVPLILVAANNDDRHLDFDKRDDARLADIAPTFISLIGLDAPASWTGRSLLLKHSE